MRQKKEDITEQYDLPMSLMEKTMKLVNEDPRGWPELWRDTGVPFYWIKNFAKGKYANPSVNRVQFLYEALSGKKLFENNN
jgi:hypothetical protein